VRGKIRHRRRNRIYTILLLLFAGALFSPRARCQTGRSEALPSLPSPIENLLQILAGGSFDITTLPSGTFQRQARGEGSAQQDTTGSSPQPQIQMRDSDHQGIVMRSVKRTLEDQKELYRGPFKRSNIKWDALVLGGTTALLVTDRHIEKHIGTAHYTFYQATSDVAIAGLGATLGGVWIWGIKSDHPHAKETGVLELETLVDTFLIYTPMQLLAGRQRPGEGNGNGDFWKHHNINTSFPGGHAMFTYAMSTVVSHEYPQKWVQALAYSAASIVTVSRFLARDHWSSDMFAGAALGIGIGAHVFHAHCDPELSDSCKHQCDGFSDQIGNGQAVSHLREQSIAFGNRVTVTKSIIPVSKRRYGASPLIRMLHPRTRSGYISISTAKFASSNGRFRFWSGIGWSGIFSGYQDSAADCPAETNNIPVE
jgi:PAP2 superfamily